MPTFTKSLNLGYYTRLVVTQKSQNIAKNQTTFSYSFQLVQGSSHWGYFHNSPGVAWSVRTPASNAFRTGTRSNPAYDFRNTSVNTIATGTRTVTHKADGTYSARWEAHWAGQSTTLGGGMCGGTVTATRIPRATAPSFSGSFTTGTAKTISLPRATSSFTHQVTYSVGGKSGTISSSAGTSVSWTPPHSLFNTSPKSTSLSGTIKVTTKSGSTTIGTKSKRFTLNLASNQTPNISEVTWTENNAHVGSTIGALVQNLSSLSGTITASGVQGSTISSSQTKIGTTTVNQGTPVLLTASGTVQGEGIVVDSRGRKDSQVGSFTVLPYNEPQVNSVNVLRTDEGGIPQDIGTYLRLDLSAEARSLIVEGVEKNALYVLVETRPVANEVWTTRGTYSSGLTHEGSIIIPGTYNLTSSFVVRVTIFDEADPENKSSVDTLVTSGEVTLDLNGTNLGVGKYWERGALDVGGELYTGGVFTSGASKFGGSLELPGNTFENLADLLAWFPEDNTEAWVNETGYKYVFKGGAWCEVGNNGRVIVGDAGDGNYLESQTDVRIHRDYNGLKRSIIIYNPAASNRAEFGIQLQEEGVSKSRFIGDPYGQLRMQTYAGSSTATGTRPLPFAVASGQVNISTTFPSVTLPGGNRFTEPPRVFTQLITGSSADQGKTSMVTQVTTTQFLARHSGSSGRILMDWVAIQMTPSNSNG